MVEPFFRSAISLLVILHVVGCSGVSRPAGNQDVHLGLFSYKGPARSVCITGDFNHWSAETHCLKEKDGTWSIRLMLPVGTHRYAFIVDGRHWVADPNALYFETDGFGRQNAVTVIN